MKTISFPLRGDLIFIKFQTLTKLICFQFSWPKAETTWREFSLNYIYICFWYQSLSFSLQTQYNFPHFWLFLRDFPSKISKPAANFSAFSQGASEVFCSRRFISSSRRSSKEIGKDFFFSARRATTLISCKYCRFRMRILQDFWQQTNLLASSLLKMFSFALVSSYYDHSTERDEIGSIRWCWHGWEISMSHGVLRLTIDYAITCLQGPWCRMCRGKC